MPGCNLNTREKKKEPSAGRQDSSARQNGIIRPIEVVKKLVKKGALPRKGRGADGVPQKYRC
jgi:hypothetical protein